MTDGKRAYGKIIRNSFFEALPQSNSKKLFAARSRTDITPIEEEEKPSASRDVYAFL